MNSTAEPQEVDHILIKYSGNKLLTFIFCVALAFLSYGGNHDHQLLRWDDISYVSENPWVINVSWDNVFSIFTEYRFFNWHPLTWLSFIPEYYFCGDNASCYINVSIFIHAINAFLLFLITLEILKLLEDNNSNNTSYIFIAAWISSFLFVIHPQHVESVIWISERKDVLYSLFYLLSLLSYIHIHKKGRASIGNAWPFIWYICALMSKSMAITLPAILVILDVFLFRRMESVPIRIWVQIVLVEKFHFYFVAIILAILTLLSQKVYGSHQPEFMDILYAISSSIQHYMRSFFIPITLSPFYPPELISIKTYTQHLFFIVPFSLVLILSIKERRWKLFWGYFFISILPVIGVFKVSDIAYADRYTYLTMAGFYIATGYVIATLMYSMNKRYLVFILLIGIVLSSIWNTRQYKNVWATDNSLWFYVAKLYPNISSKIHSNLGSSYIELGEYYKAIDQFQLAIDLQPQFTVAYFNMANTYRGLGDFENALATLKMGLKHNPDESWGYVILGDEYLKRGNQRLANQYYQEALSISLHHKTELLPLAKLYFRLGNYQKTLDLLEEREFDSDIENEAIILLVQTYYETGDMDNARRYLKKIEQNLGSSHQVLSALKALIEGH